LAGGITGLIGDPRDPKFSGGNAVERKTADRKMIEENVSYISKQYINILNSKNVVNNIDFYADMKIEDYLRDIGKRINVGYLLAKDTIARRLETGISYAEFSYTILQG
jgi:tyrosyl-tRNA synthetase